MGGGAVRWSRSPIYQLVVPELNYCQEVAIYINLMSLKVKWYESCNMHPNTQ